MRADLIKAGVLIAFLIMFQLVGAYQSNFPNFQPIAALIFCGFATLNARVSWVSIVAWLLAYPLATKLNGDYTILSSTFWVQLVCFAVIAVSAKTIFKQKGQSIQLTKLITGGLCGAVFFYIITNGFAWLTSSFYTKDWKGFYEAFWAGPKGSTMPTWHFFRNSIVANLGFTFFYWVSLQSFESKLVEAKTKVSVNS